MGDIYKQAFDAYDMDENCGYLMEECGELLSAANKLRRGRVSEDAVIEELVDTYQVIMAFAQHFGYDRFLAVLSDKRQRLKERIEKIKTKED